MTALRERKTRAILTSSNIIIIIDRCVCAHTLDVYNIFASHTNPKQIVVFRHCCSICVRFLTRSHDCVGPSLLMRLHLGMAGFLDSYLFFCSFFSSNGCCFMRYKSHTNSIHNSRNFHPRRCWSCTFDFLTFSVLFQSLALFLFDRVHSYYLPFFSLSLFP